MQLIYTFLISFILIFISELGDKTQMLVLSFSTKNKISFILIGVALGSLFSHGLAIFFGSKLGCINNNNFIYFLKLCTYITFLLFGILGFIKILKSPSNNSNKESSKSYLMNFFNSLFKNCIFLVASSIIIGEIGDKTFLASLGLGIQYPLYKFSLIIGAILGMVFSNFIAIFLGKWLVSKFSNKFIEILSNCIFIIFGLLGILEYISKI